MQPSEKSLCWCGGPLGRSVHPFYFRCESCGTHVMKTAPSDESLKAYYTVEGYWERHVQSLGYPPIQQRAESDFHDRIPIWYQLLTSYQPSPRSVLEIGCAHGGFLAYCRERGASLVVGVEVDPETCAFARQRFGLEHVCSGLFPDVALPAERFEAIVGFDVIEHFADPVRGLKAVAERLSEDGWFLFQTPCYRGEDGSWGQFKPDEHLFLFNGESIRKICAEAGLDVVSVQQGCFTDDMFVVGRKRSPVPRLLWVRTDSIGDAVLSLPMLPQVRRRYPEAEIVVVCQESVAPMYEACPAVSEIIAYNRVQALSDPGYRERLLSRISAVRAGLCLHSVYSREPLGDVLAHASHAPERIAFEGDLSNMTEEDHRRLDPVYTRLLPSEEGPKTELERNHDFLAGLGIECGELSPEVWTDPEDEVFAAALFEREGLVPGKVLALFAGAKYEIRDYGRFAEALEPICASGDHHVLALGLKSQSGLHQAILDRLPGRHLNLCGALSLRQCAAVLRRCRLAVGVETAQAHIACAVGTPNVVLLGGGHFGRFLPYSPLTSVAVLPLDCYLCNWQCPFPRPHCVKDLAPAVLERAIREALAEGSSKPRLYAQVSGWSQSGTGPNLIDLESSLNPEEVEYIAVGEEPLADPREAAAPGLMRTTVICAVWHKDPQRFELLESHQACLDRQSVPVDRVYVFDGGDNPPTWLKGEVITSRNPLSIYEAWNLALVRVRTPYVINLNLDDRLNPDGIAILEAALDDGADLAGGEWRICFDRADTDTARTSVRASELPYHAEWPPLPGRLSRLGSGSGDRPTFGPACMWRMSLHGELPRYPWRFMDGTLIRTIGDSVWWALLLARGKQLRRIPLVIGNYHSHPEGQAEFRDPAAGEEAKLASIGGAAF